MTIWHRVYLSVIILAIIIPAMSAWVSADPTAQIMQNTPTPASTPISPADPGEGQAMTIVRADANKTTALPGEQVRLYLQVKSTGRQNLEGLHVSYEAPAGLTVLNVITSRGNFSLYQGHVDINVPNLRAGDLVQIIIDAQVNSNVSEGTALVSHFKVYTSYAGAQEAVIGINVGQAKPAAKKVLPQTGAGLAMLLAGLLLAGGLIVIRQLRSRKTRAGA